MRTFLHAAACLLVLGACAPGQPADPAPQSAPFAALLEQRDCFGLRDALRTARGGGAEMHLYRAASAAAFGRFDEAVREGERFVSLPAVQADSARLVDAYSVLGAAYAKSFRYADAGRAYARASALTRDPGDAADQANTGRLWSALAGVPAQTVARSGEARVATSRDKAGLINVPVDANGVRASWVFDTGANISTATASSARAMGLRMLNDSILLGSITGARTSARVAVAPELRIGDIVVRNVAFLVLPDSALAFPQIDYQIHGIIGFPVMQAFGAFTLTRTGELILPQPSPSGSHAESNLCFPEYSPTVAVSHAGRRMHMAFDTGANRTDLYVPFYTAFRADVDARGTATTSGMGGAGGSRQVRTLVVPDVELEVGGRTARLPQAHVHTQPTTEKSHVVYGNLGQDLIRQFESMTMDFAAMQLRFQ